MRITHRPQPAVFRTQPPSARLVPTRPTQRDVFEPRSGHAPVLAQASTRAAASSLASVAERTLTSVMTRLFESIARKLGQALERFLSRAQPSAPAVEPAPSTRPLPTDTGLAPTPIGGEKPGQVAHVNTIQTPGVAPKSQFRDVVNQAIDAVRARGEGIDPQEPDRITSYDTYHSAVVRELRQRGYHAAYDGEELAVGRAGDTFNEQFDISTSTGLVRRFYASWVSPPVWA